MERGKHARVWLAGPFAFKLLRPGLGRNARKEFNYLRQLQGQGIAPRPYFRIGRLIAMERVRGTPVRDLGDADIKRAAPDFLRALHRLDELGIKKEECHRPDKHFLVTPGGVRLVDFERAHPGRGNVTQFLQFLRRFYPGITELGKKYSETLDPKPILEVTGSS